MAASWVTPLIFMLFAIGGFLLFLFLYPAMLGAFIIVIFTLALALTVGTIVSRRRRQRG